MKWCLVVFMTAFFEASRSRVIGFAPVPRLGKTSIPNTFTTKREQQQQHSSLAAMPLLIVFEELGSTYHYCLDHYHWMTQAATGGFFAYMGDIWAQSWEKDKPYNAMRSFQFMCKGLGGGLMWSTWYEMSDQVSMQLLEACTLSSGTSHDLPLDPTVMRVTVNLLLDQFVVAPLFYSSWDIPVPALLQGATMRQVPAQVQAKLVPMLWANAAVWTPANLICYNLPSDVRLLFASCTDLLWQAVSSQITTQEISVLPPPMPALPTVEEESSPSIAITPDVVPETL